MPRRGQAAEPENTDWYVSFTGNGDITEENARALLDDRLPEDQDIYLFVPEKIRRGSSLKIVTDLLDGWKLHPEQVTDHDLISRLVNASTPNKFLIVLYDDEDATIELARAALTNGIRVLDLCAALDEVELGEESVPDPEPKTPKRRGKPRTTEPDAVEVTVEGPAVITQPGAEALFSTPTVEEAIRQLIREEVENMGFSIGHNTFGPQDPAAEPNITVFTNDDGDYELPGDRKRAPRGWRSVEISPAEARELSLI